MIGFPVITGIAALIANKDYDRRWYCGSCGQTWTPQLSAVSDQNNIGNAAAALRELRQVADHARQAQQLAKPPTEQAKLSWTFLPPDVAKKRVRVQAECSCGQVIQYDDDWTDNDKVICVKCGSEHGTFADYKAQAREAVDDFIAGNVSKYRIKP
jgi:ribosomal protein S27AE